MKIWFLEERQAQYIPKIIPAPKWILLVRLFQLLGSLSILAMTIWTLWAYGSAADLFLNPPIVALTTAALSLLSLPILTPVIPLFRPLYHSWLALALELLCAAVWTAAATCLALLCHFYTSLHGIAYVPYQPLAIAAAVYLTNSTCTNTSQTVPPDALAYYSTPQLQNYLADYAAGRLAETTIFTNQPASPFLSASRAGWTAYRTSLAAAIIAAALACAFLYTLACYAWWFVQAYVANVASGTIELPGGATFAVEKPAPPVTSAARTGRLASALQVRRGESGAYAVMAGGEARGWDRATGRDEARGLDLGEWDERRGGCVRAGRVWMREGQRQRGGDEDPRTGARSRPGLDTVGMRNVPHGTW